jgi:RNA polymerase-binding transcription factor DksA
VRAVEAEPAPAGTPLDLDVLERAERELADVERALARLDAGTYDTCETCGGPIEDVRVEQEPTARTCVAHA